MKKLRHCHAMCTNTYSALEVLRTGEYIHKQALNVWGVDMIENNIHCVVKDVHLLIF